MSQTITSLPRRIWAFLMAMVIMLIVLVSGFVSPAWAPILPVQRSYIQTAVDTSAWEIVAAVVSHGVSTNGHPMEAKRIGKDLMETLIKTKTPSDSNITSFLTGGVFEKQGDNSVNNLPLSFPGAISFSGWQNESRQADIDRAQLIRNSLIYDLNAAFKFVYGDQYGMYEPEGDTLDEQVKQYATDLGNFFSGIKAGGQWTRNVNGQTISCSVVTTQEPKNPVDKNFHSNAGTDYYISIERTIGSQTETRTFQYRMLKGYGVDGSGLGKANGDTLVGANDYYIHWGTLAVEAFANYVADDELRVTASNVNDGTPGIIEQAFAEAVAGIVDWIANALGLWNFDELIFNGGVRGSSSYVGGVFPSSWQSVIWTFFFVAEIAAVIMLLYAIIFNVGKKAMSTMDPVARASAIEQIKYLFLVAFLLAVIPYVIPILIDTCAQLTGIFHDVLGGKTAQERFQKLAANSGAGLGAILSYAVYLGAVIYFNVFYVFRALSLALMIVLMPIFIAMMAISENKRRQTLDFFREFCANLFIQPLQALMLSFILLVPDSGRNIDSIVMAYVMIPLTNLLRQMFFGNSGGMADQVGQKGQRAGRGLMMLGAGLTAGAIGGGIRALAGGKGSDGKADSKEGGDGKDGGGGGDGATGVTTKPSLSQKIKNSDAGRWAAQKTEPVRNLAKSAKDFVGGLAPVQGVRSAASKLANSTGGKLLGSGVKALGGGSKVAAGLGLGAIAGAIGVVDRHFTGGAFSKPLEQLAGKTIGSGKSQVKGAGSDAEDAIFKDSRTDDGGGESALSPETAAYKSSLENRGDYKEGDNVYAKGLAERSYNSKTGASTYTLDRDSQRAAGVSVGKPSIGSAGQKQSAVKYDMSKMSQGDQTRLREMRNTWENGSEEERAAMRAMGITGFEATTKMVNGEQVMTGANITYDSDKARDNLGISTRGGYSVTAQGDQAPALVPDMPSMLNSPKAAAALGASKMESMGFQTSTDANTGAVTMTAPAAKFQNTPMPESMAAQVASAKVGKDGTMSITMSQADMASTFGPVAASSNTMGSRAMAAGISPETSMGTPTTQSTMPTMVAPAVHTGTASLGNQGLSVTPSADGQTYMISGADVQAFQKVQVPAGMASHFTAPQVAEDGSASVTVPAADFANAYTATGNGASQGSIPVATPAAHNLAGQINAQPDVQAVAVGDVVNVRAGSLETFQGMQAAQPVVEHAAWNATVTPNGAVNVQIPADIHAQAMNAAMPTVQVGTVLDPATIPTADPVKIQPVRLESTMPVPPPPAAAPAEQPTPTLSSLGQGGEQLLNGGGGGHPPAETPTPERIDGDGFHKEPEYNGPARGKSALKTRLPNYRISPNKKPPSDGRGLSLSIQDTRATSVCCFLL